MSRVVFAGLLVAVVVVGLGLGWAVNLSPPQSPDPSSGGADQGLGAVLQARYDGMKEAMDRHDAPAMASFLSPDFANIDQSGRSETGPEMIAQAVRLKDDPHRVLKMKTLAIDPEGGKAVVQQRVDMTTIAQGQDGVRHNISFVALSTDTWIKLGGEWVMERSVTDEISSFRDGKLIVHQE